MPKLNFSAIRAIQRERDALIAESEQCFEGDIPTLLLESLKKVGVMQAARLACQATKKSIAAAIRSGAIVP